MIMPNVWGSATRNIIMFYGDGCYGFDNPKCEGVRFA